MLSLEKTQDTQVEKQPKRLRLAEILPLRTPLSVQIDPTNACNFKCTFCPTGDPEILKAAGRKIANMKLDDFKAIIDDLGKFPDQLKNLILCKDGEPLLSKHIVDMVDYAKRSGVTKQVSTTSNGSLLTREKAIGLIDAGLDSIRISVEHVNDESYQKITRTFADYNMIVDNVRTLWEEREARRSNLFIDVKILDTCLTEEERIQFLTDFGPISDTARIDTLMGWSNNTDRDWTLGQDANQNPDANKEIQVCPSPFKGLAINSNGNVSLCCVDWSHETSIGNVLETPVVDLWNGEVLREFRLKHLRRQRGEINVCKDCKYIIDETEMSNIDNMADGLISAYS